jgi:hypothetical protein
MKRNFLIAIVCLLATFWTLADRAAAATINYQQGVSPSGAYSHQATGLFSTGTFASVPGGLFGGSDTVMRVGIATTPGGEILRTVLSYDLTNVPASNVITSVTLTVSVASGADDDPNLSTIGPIELHAIVPLGNTFVETEVNWFDRKAGTPWTTPGGDFSSTVLSTIGPFDPTVVASYTFPSTSQFVAAANAALSAGQPLQLIALDPTTEAALVANPTTEIFARFHSDDSATAGLRPLLTIETQAVPEPSTFALAALGLMSLGIIAWRRQRSS